MAEVNCVPLATARRTDAARTLVTDGDAEGGRGLQVPAQVDYERAASVEHALALLSRYGPEARVLAGGHSLIPMMKLRLAQPEILIGSNGITDLRDITT